jgi:hypothetical protein
MLQPRLAVKVQSWNLSTQPEVMMPQPHLAVKVQSWNLSTQPEVMKPTSGRVLDVFLSGICRIIAGMGLYAPRFGSTSKRVSDKAACFCNN